MTDKQAWRRGLAAIVLGLVALTSACGSSASEAEWACAKPSSFEAIAPPPGMEGIDVETAKDPAELAINESKLFEGHPKVTTGPRSDDSATYDIANERGQLLEQVTLRRDDDGLWVLDGATTCRRP